MRSLFALGVAVCVLAIVLAAPPVYGEHGGLEGNGLIRHIRNIEHERTRTSKLSQLSFSAAERKVHHVARELNDIISSRAKVIRAAKSKLHHTNSMLSKASVAKAAKLAEHAEEKQLKAQQTAIEQEALAKADARKSVLAAPLASAATTSSSTTRAKKSTSKKTLLKPLASPAALNPLLPRLSKSAYIPDRSESNGLWKAGSYSPPFVHKLTMYAGPGINSGMADTVRKWLGLKLSWPQRDWHTSHFLRSFDSSMFRYIARTPRAKLIFPPLSGPVPLLDTEAAHNLRRFIEVSGGSLIVCGGPDTTTFLNAILPDLGFEGSVESKWSEGPFEKQKPSLSSRFRGSPIVLGGDDVWGVTVQSLPRGAASYYEAPGVSVVWGLQIGKGQIIFVGSTMGEKLAVWKQVLFDAAETGPWDLEK